MHGASKIRARAKSENNFSSGANYHTVSCSKVAVPLLRVVETSCKPDEMMDKFEQNLNVNPKFMST